MMKVFKVNDCDWVAAKDEFEAMQFYANQPGFELAEIEEEFEGEVSLDETMLILADELPEDEKVQVEELVKHGNELWIRKPFS